MIKTHSDDPDVEAAAHQAADIVEATLKDMPKAETFDYGGHDLQLGEYDVCIRCTMPIAEAQAAHQKLLDRAKDIEDPVVKEHVELAAQLFALEAKAAEVRAELHNGQGSERIVNALLGYLYSRDIQDHPDHSHHGGN